MNPLALTTDLEDVQAQGDDRGIAIDEVGISDLQVPIVIAGRDGSTQSTVATVEMAVDLAADVRGTHMSRFVDVLHSAGEPLSGRVVAALSEDVRERLAAGRAVVRLAFPYFILREAPVTRQAAPVPYEGRLEAVAGRGAQVRVGVRTPVTSLCPCSREISDYGAHNQRGYVEIEATCSSEEVLFIEDLVDVAEQAASAPVYSMLKRPDERHVTMQAYDSPAFVEDIARDAAVALRHDARIERFSVRVINLESIHAHNAVATIRGERR